MFCFQCRNHLDNAPDLAGQQVRCPYCGIIFVMPGIAPSVPPPPPPVAPVRASTYSKRQRREPRSEIARGVAAILSLLMPGLGQVLQGRIYSALVMWFGLAIGIVVAVLTYPIAGFPGLAIIFLVSVWSVIDAAVAP